MIRFFLIMFCGCVFSFCSWAQDDPTIVYGAANMGEGKENVFVVEQSLFLPILCAKENSLWKITPMLS